MNWLGWKELLCKLDLAREEPDKCMTKTIPDPREKIQQVRLRSHKLFMMAAKNPLSTIALEATGLLGQASSPR